MTPPQPSKTVFTHPLFALGFRPFFALAGLAALALILIWNAALKGELTLNNYFTHANWHAHEMLLGFASAVIAGFLLTAVKNWTGKATLTGDPLAGLCLLWLYGRILPFYHGLLPDVLIAAVDFAFLPTLAYQLSKPIISAKYQPGWIFIGLLLLLATGNGLIHAERLGLGDSLSATGFQLVIATLMLLILVIAGRVLPFFTERCLPGTLIIKNPTLDYAALATAGLVFLLQLFDVSGGWLAAAASMAALANSARILLWYVPRIWYVPLLWVLYLGYCWIILGFVVTALSAFQVVPTSLAAHAFTIGGIGVLTLGMMARVALGHTGRALKASNTIALAFVLINLAAVSRVLLPMTLPAGYSFFVYASTLCWLAAFALFVLVYEPILSNPRVDGQDG